MKIIIPMAGAGKRLRPFTLTTPKPLLKLAGKTIVQRLVEKITSLISEKVTDVGFIVGNIPADVIQDLHNIGTQLNFKTHIFYQEEALGTAHAINFAKDLLKGNVIIAYADTLFEADFKLDSESDVVIWTKKVSNPELYGVVVKDGDFIKSFYEKPKTFISDEAIIGIYYFKNGELLRDKIDYILYNNVLENNEYQLTNALQMMLDDGLVFTSQTVKDWLDCGNKELVLNTMFHLLNSNQYETSNQYISENSVVIQPSFIGKNVKLTNSIVGPNVSIEDNAEITNSVITNSIIYNSAKVINSNVTNSINGNFSVIESIPKVLALADYDNIKI
jgi:glucose-1-phosphate thymidylyltransferase